MCGHPVPAHNERAGGICPLERSCLSIMGAELRLYAASFLPLGGLGIIWPLFFLGHPVLWGSVA